MCRQTAGPAVPVEVSQSSGVGVGAAHRCKKGVIVRRSVMATGEWVLVPRRVCGARPRQQEVRQLRT